MLIGQGWPFIVIPETQHCGATTMNAYRNRFSADTMLLYRFLAVERFTFG
jgi:hypothetical protein